MLRALIRGATNYKRGFITCTSSQFRYLSSHQQVNGGAKQTFIKNIVNHYTTIFSPQDPNLNTSAPVFLIRGKVVPRSHLDDCEDEESLPSYSTTPGFFLNMKPQWFNIEYQGTAHKVYFRGDAKMKKILKNKFFRSVLGFRHISLESLKLHKLYDGQTMEEIEGHIRAEELESGMTIKVISSFITDTEQPTEQQIVADMIKTSGHKIDEADMAEFIEYFSSELAIVAPRILNEIKANPEMRLRAKKILANRVKYFYFEKKMKALGKKRNAVAEDLATLKFPHLWFPKARTIKRTFVLHVGPTNSGKTHHALERLFEAESGVYCGPLRLLAHEIYDKFGEKKIPCSLLTGQIKKIDENAAHVACTVEMADVDNLVEVAVIDEFQMIADYSRGWAWTRAILGIPAMEVHLCGDSTAVELVKSLCEITGDEVVVRTYEKLSPLSVAERSVTLGGLKKGDCLIGFSRRQILEMKELLETKYNKRCAVVYGSLPPHTRYEQAKLYNEDQFDVLIATDAIGMGLNLNISRIIFMQLEKFDGESMRQLFDTEIKQIAGRAGRFNFASKSGTGGLVSSFKSKDIKHITKALASPPLQSERAAVFPQGEQIEIYAQHPDNADLPFSKLLSRFIDNTNLDRLYFLENYERKIELLTIIDEVDLPVKDKYHFVMAPSNMKNPLMPKYIRFYAEALYRGDDVPHLVNISKMPPSNPALISQYLEKLEHQYNILDLYLWLSQKYKSFTQQEEAQQLSYKITQIITKTLINTKRKSLETQRIQKEFVDQPKNRTALITHLKTKSKKF